MLGEILEFKKPQKLLVLSDTHLSQESGQKQHDLVAAISDEIWDEQPDHVAHLGDLGDFPGLLEYRGSTLAGGDGRDENLDLVGDFEAFKSGLAALKRRFNFEKERNRKNRRNDRTPNIQWHMMFGNHENKIFELAAKYKVLRRLPYLPEFNLSQMCLDEGWTPYPFLEPLTINGLTMQHYFQGLNKKVALGMASVRRENGGSSLFGHTHRQEVINWNDPHMRSRHIINTGCTIHPDSLVKMKARHARSGILIIENLEDGMFTHRWIPSEILLRKYYEKNGGLLAA